MSKSSIILHDQYELLIKVGMSEVEGLEWVDDLYVGEEDFYYNQPESEKYKVGDPAVKMRESDARTLIEKQITEWLPEKMGWDSFAVWHLKDEVNFAWYTTDMYIDCDPMTSMPAKDVITAAIELLEEHDLLDGDSDD